MIVYDSTYRYTEKIAQAVSESIDDEARGVGELSAAYPEGLDLLIVGTPVHGGHPAPAIRDFLKSLPVLEGMRVATFDTRTVKWSWIFGYAAPKVAQSLERRGGRLTAPPEGFFVLGSEGPLKDGEIERAADWARAISE